MQQNKKSNTPIADFVRNYERSGMCRFHMPGHKGKSFLGCEAFDITEIKGADSLYEADGIIAESEKIASELFGSGATFYSTEGSSQCIRAMLYLALMNHREKNSISEIHEEKDVFSTTSPESMAVIEFASNTKHVAENTRRPVIVAARNVHKAFIYAAALLDFDVVWLWPEAGMESLCSCRITAEQLETTLTKLKDASISVAAVYITSPDYLGGLADIRSVADICHAYDTLLLVDNAHGAYLHFLDTPVHPLDLGADICCDSAHKTFPVLTGGAYLHISKDAPIDLIEQAKHALCLFGSTSPSYLIMASLDLCNAYLMDNYKERLDERRKELDGVREDLAKLGWQTEKMDPLRITIRMPIGLSGKKMANQLRHHDIECEYADDEFLVLMITPENEKEDFKKLLDAMGENELPYLPVESLPMAKTEQKMTIREAMFSASETIAVSETYGRICRTPTVSCPPAIPVAVPGELIGENVINLFRHYGIDVVDVVK